MRERKMATTKEKSTERKKSLQNQLLQRRYNMIAFEYMCLYFGFRCLVTAV